MRKLISLFLTLSILFTVSMAFAGTVCPIIAGHEDLAGKTVHATVGEYNAETGTFTVTVYDYDQYDKDDIAGLAVGDTVLAGGWLHKIDGTENGYWTCDDGEEICFGQYGNSIQARSAFDDRVFMNIITVLHIPAAGGIVYEDYSDSDADPAITKGLEEILKIKAEKEETSIGFNYYATTITLNDDMEIVKIHQDFDVAQ